MPKSTPRKRGHDANRVKAQRRVEDIIARAQALDRRRVAQISNQVQTINRLLAQFHLHPEMMQDLVYGEEMKILHEGAATLMAERDEAREALRELVSVVTEHAQGHDQFGALSDAVKHAEAVSGQ